MTSTKRRLSNTAHLQQLLSEQSHALLRRLSPRYFSFHGFSSLSLLCLLSNFSQPFSFQCSPSIYPLCLPSHVHISSLHSLDSFSLSLSAPPSSSVQWFSPQPPLPSMCSSLFLSSPSEGLCSRLSGIRGNGRRGCTCMGWGD